MKKILSIILLTLPLYCWSDDFIGWKKISTEHFTFIFEEYDRETAFELADCSEDIYEVVTSFFDFHPKKINVYINSRIDSLNGMFYPIPGSINLYPVYPMNSKNATKSDSWLFELLLHEVVHYVHLENRKGLFGGLSYIFGKDLAAVNATFLPAWMIEGIAVYLESRFTEGGRGANRYFEAYTKSAAVEEDFFNIYQLAYSSDFPPYNRIYSGGYELIKYFMENFGEDIFQKIYLRYTRFPFIGPFGAVKRETGKSIRDIFNDFKAETIQHYSSLDFPEKEYPSVKLSPDSYGDRTHAINTDQGIILYRTDHNASPAIVLFDEKKGEETVLIETRLMDGSSFDADRTGNMIVFASGNYKLYNSYGNSYISDLYLYKDNSVKKLTENQSLFHPAVSSDGTRIIAVKRTGSYTKLVSVDLQTGLTEDLFFKEQTSVMNPVFSPDDNEIAFIVNDHGYQDIYTLPLSHPLSAAPIFSIDRHSEYYPRYINDSELSFISDRDEDLSLYKFDLEKKTLELVYKDPVGVAEGFIEGDKIYYSTYRTKGFEFRSGEILKSQDYPLFEEKAVLPVTEISTYTMKKYIDWTFPYLWLPKPYIQFSSTMGNMWGFGAAVFAGSFAQSGEWVLDLNYMPESGQIAGQFDYSRKLGKSTLSYSLNQSFREFSYNSEYFWRQGTVQSLAISFPLFELNNLNWRDVLNTYSFVKHSRFISEWEAFSFPESFSADKEDIIHAGTGLMMSNYRINNSRKALFGGLSLSNQLDFSILLPILSSSKTSFTIMESGTLKLPLGPEGFLLQTGWHGVFHNSGVSSAYVHARGRTPENSNSDFSLYYSMSYLMPIALVDWGIPGGYNVQNIAVAFHLEGITNFSINNPASHEFYAALEFIGTYGYNYGKTPIGMGVNFRFYRNGEAFNPAEDITIYTFFSMNSLFK